MSKTSGNTVFPIKAIASGIAQCAWTSTVLTLRPPTTWRRGAALPDGDRGCTASVTLSTHYSATLA
jgi:hypothetical protein